MDTQAILDHHFFCDDLDRSLTIREYLQELLLTLWEEKEGFSGKRPFGNSGWEADLERELIILGEVDGRLDDSGYIDSVDTDAAYAAVVRLIHAAFEER